MSMPPAPWDHPTRNSSGPSRTNCDVPKTGPLSCPSHQRATQPVRTPLPAASSPADAPLWVDPDDLPLRSLLRGASAPPPGAPPAPQSASLRAEGGDRADAALATHPRGGTKPRLPSPRHRGSKRRLSATSPPARVPKAPRRGASSSNATPSRSMQPHSTHSVLLTDLALQSITHQAVSQGGHCPAHSTAGGPSPGVTDANAAAQALGDLPPRPLSLTPSSVLACLTHTPPPTSVTHTQHHGDDCDRQSGADHRDRGARGDALPPGGL